VQLVQEGLQDQGGGDLVHEGSVGLPSVTSFVEDLVGLMRCKALVPKVDGHFRQVLQLGGEGLDLCGLRCGLAIWAERISDYNSGDCVAAAKTGQRTKVFSSIAAALQGKYRLGGETQFIGNSHANTF